MEIAARTGRLIGGVFERVIVGVDTDGWIPVHFEGTGHYNERIVSIRLSLLDLETEVKLSTNPFVSPSLANLKVYRCPRKDVFRIIQERIRP